MPTVKNFALEKIASAKSLLATAEDDLQRNDRVGALDALRMSATDMQLAVNALKATFEQRKKS